MLSEGGTSLRFQGVTPCANSSTLKRVVRGIDFSVFRISRFVRQARGSSLPPLPSSGNAMLPDVSTTKTTRREFVRIP